LELDPIQTQEQADDICVAQRLGCVLLFAEEALGYDAEKEQYISKKKIGVEQCDKGQWIQITWSAQRTGAGQGKKRCTIRFNQRQRKRKVSSIIGRHSGQTSEFPARQQKACSTQAKGRCTGDV
jgi:hypothetical protein